MLEEVVEQHLRNASPGGGLGIKSLWPGARAGRVRGIETGKPGADSQIRRKFPEKF